MTSFKEWEKDTPYFDGCLPIEVMAARGRETLRFGPMKPVGLTNPHPGCDKPYAVVQLRQDNALGTLWNMVGFQTKLRHGEQSRIFRTIPGLQHAEFAPPRRPASQYVSQFAEAARPVAAPEGHATAAFRRPDHGRGGLRRKRRLRIAGRPVRRRGKTGAGAAHAATDHGPRRAARAHHPVATFPAKRLTAHDHFSP